MYSDVQLSKNYWLTLAIPFVCLVVQSLYSISIYKARKNKDSMALGAQMFMEMCVDRSLSQSTWRTFDYIIA